MSPRRWRRGGSQPGDHVALSCPNLPWFPIAYYGILKAGAVVVPLNVLLKPREIAYHLKDSDAKAMLAFEGAADLPLAAMAKAACDEAGSQQLLVMTLAPDAPSPVEGVQTLTQAMLAANPAPFQTRRRRMDDTAVILYTSGTTGHPKGAELTHANMLLNAVASRDMYLPALRGGMEQEVALVTLPLFHSTAQTCLMNAGLLRGFRLVLMPRFDPAAVLDVMEREQVGLLDWRAHHVLGAAEPRQIGRHRPGAGRQASAPVRVWRRRHAARGDARVRVGLRRAHPRGLRAVGDVAGRLLQPAAPSDQAGDGRSADLRRGRPLRGRRGAVPADRSSPGKSSSAARTS